MNYNGTQPQLSTSDEDTDMFETPNQTGSPERRLLLAVLERAILDFVGNDKREIDSAQEWIFTQYDDSNRSAFSFEWVCQQLDLNPTDIAETVRRMPKRGSSKIAPWYINRQTPSSDQPTKGTPKKFKDTKVRSVDFGMPARTQTAKVH